jgi:N-acetylmuramoyl-L-alanine amidase
MIAAAHAAPPAPIVWVQAGHRAPREPGYRAQTGAGTGPFGNEVAFTKRLARRVVVRLRSAGVSARLTPGRVTPYAARGDVFISLHHDSLGGHAAIGHAIRGARENWYHGEGFGTASPVPYPDSARHRPATRVSRTVERNSRNLAVRLAATLGAIHTRSNGARGAFTGVESRRGNPRMMRYYGFYRTQARARVLVEAGAPGVDDAFLRRLDPIATAVTTAITRYLRARGRLAASGLSTAR